MQTGKPTATIGWTRSFGATCDQCLAAFRGLIEFGSTPLAADSLPEPHCWETYGNLDFGKLAIQTSLACTERTGCSMSPVSVATGDARRDSQGNVCPDSHLTGPTPRISKARPVAPDNGWAFLDRRRPRRELYRLATPYRRLAIATFLRLLNGESCDSLLHILTKVPLSSRGPLIVIPPLSSQ